MRHGHRGKAERCRRRRETSELSGRAEGVVRNMPNVFSSL